MNSLAGVGTAWLAEQFPDLSKLSPLAGGGQKLVYSAQHATDGDVVLKLVRPPFDLDTVHREVLAVKQVASPRVPMILATGTIGSSLGDCFWLREARVNGESVRTVLRRGAMAPAAVLKLGAQTLEALVAAEGVSIVHRDVKPENIMIALSGDAFLLDFGIARHLQLSSQTPTAAPFGKCTPGYAPPEQFRNLKDDIDARSDLFALGVTLYECGTGVNPFIADSANQIEVLQRVMSQPLPPLTLPIAGAGDLTDLVLAMTQRRRDHRPATARAALTWIQEILAKQRSSQS